MSALGKKILDELGDTAIRWLESLGEKYRKMDIGVDTEIETLAGKAGESLSGLEAKAPEFFSKYEKIPLFQAMQEGNLALMKPKTFRQLAARLGDDEGTYSPLFDDSVEKIQKYADMYKYGELFDDIPYLRFKEETPTDYQIVAHEGRHRNRGLESLGEPVSLVRMLPTEEMDYLTDKSNYTREMLNLTDVKANPTFYDELSSFQPKGGAKVGTLGEIMEIVNIPSYKQFGALRNLK
jgi:hypothetical protein